EDLGYGSVHGGVILEKSIGTAHLRDGAVTKAKMNIDLFEVPFTEIFGSANALVNNRLYVINRTYETGIDNTERNRFLGSIFLNRNFKKVYLRVWTEDTLTTANSARTFQVLNGANGEVVRVGGTPLECTIYPVDPNQNRNGRECSNYLASSSPIWNPLLILRATQTTGLPSAAFKWYLSFE
ncbi:MAG: hypothetical protein NZO16_06560, partial [Deltaproteobacteria bacterium]|nr:hypothetical protein [Deltaproteobacteria bacterium]